MRGERTLVPSMILRETPHEMGGGHSREELVELSCEAIRHGSRSFASASQLFGRYTREKVWLLYAWCRRCDDIADNQKLGGDLGEQSRKHDRVGAIRILTARALDGLPTADPAFDAFGVVAKECGITARMTEDVITGFEMDADDWRPRTEDDLLRYCYHVAGAVGVMMAVVMGVSPHDDEVLDRACDLGMAFQLANIARDIYEDDAAGRCYLPIEWLVEEDVEPGQHMKPHHRQELVDMVARLVDLMDTHAAAARIGTKSLSFRNRWAVLAATKIYTGIGHEVRQRGPAAWDHRVRISRLDKARFISSSFWESLRNRPERVPLPQWKRELLGPAAGNGGVSTPLMG